MKSLLLSLLFVLFTANSFAQEKTSDYIYSSDGFEVLTAEHVVEGFGNEKYFCTGLYTKDRKVLVSACSSYSNYGSSVQTFYVPYGTEVIASRAFQKFNGGSIYIPSTVKYIAPDALTCNVYGGTNPTYPNIIYGISDDCTISNPSKVKEVIIDNGNPEEVGRYNVNGMRIGENEEGIQIIQYNNGTSKKIIK